MVTIAITPEAFTIIRAALPHGCKIELRPDGYGGYVVTLPNGVLDRLKAMRCPGESYSDPIIRVARGEEEWSEPRLRSPLPLRIPCE
jgi:hypothetical protein